MEIWRKAQIVFTIRTYNEQDFAAVVEVYQSSFSAPPWNEQLKCGGCSKPYDFGTDLVDCVKCNSPLDFVPFWSEDDVRAEIDFSQAQDGGVVLVAQAETSELVGLLWGYPLPQGKFPFLDDMLTARTHYLDDVAVHAQWRERGVGSALGKAYLARAAKWGAQGSLLRTKESYDASRGLFEKLGYVLIDRDGTTIYDTEYPESIFMWRDA